MAESTRVRLTQQVKAGGCASKLAPGSLAAVLSRLPKRATLTCWLASTPLMTQASTESAQN